jgi:hypothetical protein
VAGALQRDFEFGIRPRSPASIRMPARTVSEPKIAISSSLPLKRFDEGLGVAVLTPQTHCFMPRPAKGAAVAMYHDRVHPDQDAGLRRGRQRHAGLPFVRTSLLEKAYSAQSHRGLRLAGT